MADEKRIRARIAEIAGRPKNVSFEEIEWVAKQLSQFYPVEQRRATHGILFRVGRTRFMVSSHNPGSKNVKPTYVDDFCDAMFELGWYDG